MTTHRLNDHIDPADSQSVRSEAEHMFDQFFPEGPPTLFAKTFDTVERLFKGSYPGYRASNTKYHDFEHTCAVLLATTRLAYGAMAEEYAFDRSNVLKGTLAALFHDTGLIQNDDDFSGTGAKHTVGHEERSIQVMRECLASDLSPEDIEDIADCIRCTTLSMPPHKIAFRDEEVRTMAHFLGTADILAQIGDPNYLKKLLLLYEEFKEARLPGYDSHFELLSKTRNFYQEVARPRLHNEFGNAARFMAPYFLKRWGIDKDLYREAIHRNLDKLDAIRAECDEDMNCYLSHLSK